MYSRHYDKSHNYKMHRQCHWLVCHKMASAQCTVHRATSFLSLFNSYIIYQCREVLQLKEVWLSQWLSFVISPKCMTLNSQCGSMSHAWHRRTSIICVAYILCTDNRVMRSQQNWSLLLCFHISTIKMMFSQDFLLDTGTSVWSARGSMGGA